MFVDFPGDFRYVLRLQQAVVVGMADGYAQPTRNAACVNLHLALGVGHAMGATFTAYKNRTPMLITAGQQSRSLLPFDSFLASARATELPRPYVKWAVEPARAKDVPLNGFLRIATLALACAFGATVQAQTWPSKPIRIVVTFPPGGAADQIARSVSAPLQTALSQNVVVANRAGSGGNLGSDAVAKSPADGTALLMSSGGMVLVNPHIYAKMPFDPAKDLVSGGPPRRVCWSSWWCAAKTRRRT